VRTWALDVADDGTGLVVHELDAALSDTTTGACCYPSACHSLTLCIPQLLYALVSQKSSGSSESSRTGSAKDTGDLDEVDGGLSRVHFVRL